MYGMITFSVQCRMMRQRQRNIRLRKRQRKAIDDCFFSCYNAVEAFIRR